MKPYDLIIRGRSVRVFAQKIKNQIWFHYQGQTRVVDLVPLAQKASSKKSKGVSDQILAPMPGKILKVLCSKGQKVKPQQPLVVMEAMKMEYTLSSDIDGEVVELFCKESEQVSLGTQLVQLKSHAEVTK